MGENLQEQRKRFAQWKSSVPRAIGQKWARELGKPFENISAIEAIGRLKNDGHIRSITLVNAPPRTVSTVIAKTLAESLSLDLQGLPIFHEVLKDSEFINDDRDACATNLRLRADVEGYAGSDIFIGKLIDEGILNKKGADIVTKIMSHEFTGNSLRALLPFIDNVVSSARHPAIHINCIEDAVLKEAQYDYDFQFNIKDYMEDPIVKYWKGFGDNIDIIDTFAKQNPKMKHVVINGDGFLLRPQSILPDICQKLNLQYSEKMFQSMTIPVFFSYTDTWGQDGIRATSFDPGRKREIPDDPKKNLKLDYLPLYDKLEPIYEKIAARHPEIKNIRVPPPQKDWRGAENDRRRSGVLPDMPS